MIVITILSIMALAIAPRISNFFGSERGNFVIFRSIIAKTFDDAFLKGHINFLVVHLYSPNSDSEENKNTITSRNNAISVVNLNPDDGSFTDSKNRLLAPRMFSETFKLEEVVLSSGEKISEGNVFIPFYPEGFSDDVIIHILENDEYRWSVVISKMQKEPILLQDYVDFEQVWQSDVY
jgi:hypothetical protein